MGKSAGRKARPTKCAACRNGEHAECDPQVPCACTVCARARRKASEAAADDQIEAKQLALTGMEDVRHPKLYPIGERMLELERERRRAKEEIDRRAREALEIMRQEGIQRYAYETLVLEIKDKHEVKARERKKPEPKKRKRGRRA